MQLLFGVIAGISLVYLLHRLPRCEYEGCDGRLKFPIAKKPYCKKCGRAPSESDVQI
jgi:hypothetical protein